MPIERADFAWYSAESKKHGLPPRCPLADSELCPRYYGSRWVLASVCVTASMSPERQAQLDRKWGPYKSVVRDEDPVIFYVSEPIKIGYLDRFCPEVSYETFGYFASYLSAYADEIDRKIDKEAYKREGIAEQFDYQWETVQPRHYTECREYSIHGSFAAGGPSKARRKRVGKSPLLRWRVLARDSFTCVYCGRRPPEVSLQVDHKISVKNGGSDELDNLVTSCDECNRGKGSASV